LAFGPFSAVGHPPSSFQRFSFHLFRRGVAGVADPGEIREFSGLREASYTTASSFQRFSMSAFQFFRRPPSREASYTGHHFGVWTFFRPPFPCTIKPSA
jgi:hypothetical protein